ncbi:MAG: hypothetical protein ACRESR_06210 [Gammaproteobacteria bacterium]
MMFRGAPGLTKAQLGEIIALLGGNMNAFTEDNFTSDYYCATTGGGPGWS